MKEMMGDLKEKTDISRLGWLLFVVSRINEKALVVSGIIDIKIVGRFKTVLTDKQGPTIDSKKRLKTVHLECDGENERKANMVLANVYGSSSVDFLLVSGCS